MDAALLQTGEPGESTTWEAVSYTGGDAELPMVVGDKVEFASGLMMIGRPGNPAHELLYQLDPSGEVIRFDGIQSYGIKRYLEISGMVQISANTLTVALDGQPAEPVDASPERLASRQGGTTASLRRIETQQ